MEMSSVVGRFAWWRITEARGPRVDKSSIRSIDYKCDSYVKHKSLRNVS